MNQMLYIRRILVSPTSPLCNNHVESSWHTIHCFYAKSAWEYAASPLIDENNDVNWLRRSKMGMETTKMWSGLHFISLCVSRTGKTGTNLCLTINPSRNQITPLEKPYILLEISGTLISLVTLLHQRKLVAKSSEIQIGFTCMLMLRLLQKLL